MRVIENTTTSFIIKALLGLLTMACFQNAASQEVIVEWSKTFGGSVYDYARSVQQTSDGGYILCGITYSYGAGSSDAWLIKTNANGDQIWQRTFGGSGTDRAFSVQHTSDGGYILCGETTSYGAGSIDGWLIKTKANGNQMWQRTFGGSANDYAFSVQQTSDGGYILGGSTGSYGDGSDGWLIKTNANGNQMWQRTFGGSNVDEATSVQQTSDGGYILAGETESYGAGYSDVWLIKTDAYGNQVWQRTFGGSNRDRASSVQQTYDGGYILCGVTESYGAGNFDVWLIKVNTNSQCSISVTDPDGGESWDEGSIHPITWTSSETSGNVKIRLSYNSGSSWTTIKSSTPDDGRWNWTLPSVSYDRTNCRIRVEDAANSNCYDISNNNLTIKNVANCSITVTVPNGAESWKEGSTHPVTWTSSETSGYVKIKLSYNSGSSWTTIKSSTPDDGSWNWTLPYVSYDRTNCRIRIEDTANSNCYDISNNNFTIKDVPVLFSISGTINYYEGNRPVSGVQTSLSPTGQIVVSASNGNYSFTDLEKGIDYIVTPAKASGSHQSNTTITSQDAYEAGQIAFGIISPNSYQTLASDVDEDGQILMWDASLIARYSARMQLPAEAKVGDWRFDPGLRNYAALDSDQSGQNYTAVVIGDVDGSWTVNSNLMLAQPMFENSFKTLITDSNRIHIPVSFEKDIEVTSLDLQVQYNTDELHYIGFNGSALNEDFHTFENPASGMIRIAGFALSVHSILKQHKIADIQHNRNII